MKKAKLSISPETSPKDTRKCLKDAGKSPSGSRMIMSPTKRTKVTPEKATPQKAQLTPNTKITPAKFFSSPVRGTPSPRNKYVSENSTASPKNLTPNRLGARRNLMSSGESDVSSSKRRLMTGEENDVSLDIKASPRKRICTPVKSGPPSRTNTPVKGVLTPNKSMSTPSKGILSSPAVRSLRGTPNKLSPGKVTFKDSPSKRSQSQGHLTPSMLSVKHKKHEPPKSTSPKSATKFTGLRSKQASLVS